MTMLSHTISSRHFDAAKRVIAGGVCSAMRAFQKPVPLYIECGYGARLQDVDGNEYIDYALAHGPLILGHCHPKISEGVEKQIRRGSTYGCQHDLEVPVAEAILNLLPWAQKVIFSNTGTEAVQVALRIARAVTGRLIVVRFEGHYHGWADNILIGHRHPRPLEKFSNESGLITGAGQSKAVLQEILVLPWNDPAAVDAAFAKYGDRIAAVITEPVQVNMGSIVPAPGYLEHLRLVTRQHGAALIFDEVITGFRLAAGGASEYFGVAPDLAVFAKAIAGGYPLSAVAGTQEMMDCVASAGVRHLGTFNANPIVMAAALATIGVLTDPAEDIYGRIAKHGGKLFAGLAALSTQEFPIFVQGLPSCFHSIFQSGRGIRSYRDYLSYDQRPALAWQEAALGHGIFQMGDAKWYVSGVHNERDISDTLERAARTVETLAKSRETAGANLR